MNKREWMLQAALTVLGTKTDLDGSQVEELAVLYDAIVEASGDEGWIEHRGEKPYPEGMVEICCRDGNREVGDADGFFWDRDLANPSCDIIRWRPAR